MVVCGGLVEVSDGVLVEVLFNGGLVDVLVDVIVESLVEVLLTECRLR
jgi:hypothetical protein